MERITDHEERALSRVLSQYRDKPRFENLVALQVSFAQKLEDAAFEFFEAVALPTAEGAQLDQLGRIVGQEREGRSDADYRVWIAARISVNRGSSTVPELVQVLQAISPAGAMIKLEQLFPAGFQAAILGVVTSATLAAQINRILQLAKGGGIRAVLYWEPSASGALFRFDSGPGFDVGLFAGVAAE